MSSRIEEELELLRCWFGDSLEYLPEGHWVRLSPYRIASALWTPNNVEVAFQIPPGIPGQAPYAFHVRPRLALADGRDILNYSYPANTAWGGDWGTFSWQLDSWNPGAEVEKGSNMLNFARSFADRFKEGP
jgi:hypothetical protein